VICSTNASQSDLQGLCSDHGLDCLVLGRVLQRIVVLAELTARGLRSSRGYNNSKGGSEREVGLMYNSPWTLIHFRDQFIVVS